MAFISLLACWGPCDTPSGLVLSWKISQDSGAVPSVGLAEPEDSGSVCSLETPVQVQPHSPHLGSPTPHWGSVWDVVHPVRSLESRCSGVVLGAGCLTQTQIPDPHKESQHSAETTLCARFGHAPFLVPRMGGALPKPKFPDAS